MSARGEIARARSALEAAQSDLYTIQLKLAPLRQQERRALAKLGECTRRLLALEGTDAAPPAPDAAAVVELARLYEGLPATDSTPCDVEAVR